MVPWKRHTTRPDWAGQAAVALALVCIVVACGRAHSAPAHGTKTIEIRPDGTIVTSRNGKVIDVDRHTLSAPRSYAKARPATPPAERVHGAIESARAAAGPVTQAGQPSAAASAPHSLREQPAPALPESRRVGWRELVGILLLLTAFLAFFTSYCLLLVAAFQQSPGWGLALVFLPPIASLIFLTLHFDRARLAFQVAVLGGVLLLLTLGLAVVFHTA